MNKTDIEYLTHTWNPLAMRCTKCSPACDHCWHLRWASRHAANPTFSDEMRAAYAGDAPPLLIERRLGEPLRTRKPAQIGVQFMGDLFHEKVKLHDQFRVWQAMRDSPRHTFFILTKRPARMKRLLKTYIADHEFGYGPLPNVHLGVTAEDQQRADERIPLLLATPAAVRFVSCEPLLSGIRFHDRWLSGYHYESGSLTDDVRRVENDALNLVITGAETGPGKRPMKLDWARSLRDQCQAAGVLFFFKRDSDGNRELDGRLWEQMPE